MEEKDINEFMNMVLPLLKDLPEEEIKKEINNINMPEEEKRIFIDAITMLKQSEKSEDLKLQNT